MPLLVTPRFGCRGRFPAGKPDLAWHLARGGNPPSCRLDSGVHLSWPIIKLGQRCCWSFKGGFLVARGGSEFLRTGPHDNMLDTEVM